MGCAESKSTSTSPRNIPSSKQSDPASVDQTDNPDTELTDVGRTPEAVENDGEVEGEVEVMGEVMSEVDGSSTACTPDPNCSKSNVTG